MTATATVTPLRRAVAGQGRAMLQKGQQTKAAIVDAALGLATQIGLEGLSIGVLAEVTQMSKSGVFAHFGSREELQISVVREYHTRFEDEVFYPAMKAERGIARLRALFANWMTRTSVEIDSGCIYISGAVEFDDRPGPVRDELASSVHIWLAAMQRAVVGAQELGHLDARANPEDLLFQIHGLILALHYEARFLKTPGSVARAVRGFEEILARHAQSAPACVAQPHPEPHVQTRPETRPEPEPPIKPPIKPVRSARAATPTPSSPFVKPKKGS